MHWRNPSTSLAMVTLGKPFTEVSNDNGQDRRNRPIQIAYRGLSKVNNKYSTLTERERTGLWPCNNELSLRSTSVNEATCPIPSTESVKRRKSGPDISDGLSMNNQIIAYSATITDISWSSSSDNIWIVITLNNSHLYWLGTLRYWRESLFSHLISSFSSFWQDSIFVADSIQFNLNFRSGQSGIRNFQIVFRTSKLQKWLKQVEMEIGHYETEIENNAIEVGTL
jgi:hypothetical protein